MSVLQAIWDILGTAAVFYWIFCEIARAICVYRFEKEHYVCGPYEEAGEYYTDEEWEEIERIMDED